MNFRHAALPLAISAVIAFPMAASGDDNGAKAISYLSFDQISTEVDNPAAIAALLFQDVEASATCILEGFPYVVPPGELPEANWNPYRECISQTGIPVPTSDAPPCDTVVDNDDFFEIPGYPNNKLCHADVQMFSTPGGNPGGGDPELPTENPRGASATNIAQIQLDKAGDCAGGLTCNGNSNTQNRLNVVIAAGSAPTSVTVSLLYDYCRQGKLEPPAGAGSFAAPTTFADVTFAEVIPDPNNPGSTCTIDRFAATAPDAVTDPASLMSELNGLFSTIGPGPANTVQQPSQLVAVGPPDYDPNECFATPGVARPTPSDAGLLGVIRSNPNFPLAPPANCDLTLPGPDGILGTCDDIDDNLACIELQPQVAVTGNPALDFPRYVQSLDDSKIVTAELTPDDVDVYKWYFMKQRADDQPTLPKPIAEDVELNDQFVSSTMDVFALTGLWNSAGKNGPRELPDTHYDCYNLSGIPVAPNPRVVQIETDNFGFDTVTLTSASDLCVPSIKTYLGDTAGSLAGPAYRCYRATSREFAPTDVTLDDQFFVDKPHSLLRLTHLCAPVGINADAPEPPTDPEARDHLACYGFPTSRLDPALDVLVNDQFIQASGVVPPVEATVEFEEAMCEPARKTLL